MSYTPLSAHTAQTIITQGGVFSALNKKHYLDETGYRNLIAFNDSDIEISLIKFWGSYGHEKDLWEMGITGINGNPDYVIYSDVTESDLIETIKTLRGSYER